MRAWTTTVFLLIALSGCVDDPEHESLYASDRADSTSLLASTTIQYEGSCEFLLNCSTYSDGKVNWGCGGSGCTADMPFIAAPASFAGVCGEEVTICLAGTDTCTVAEVKDMSCCNRWEASGTVLRNLGVSFGESVSACSGFGEAKVTIYRGGQGVPPATNGNFTGVYCAQSGGSCGGNTPCWSDCPSGSVCDFSGGSWGQCVE